MPLSVPLELAVRNFAKGETTRQLGTGDSSGVLRLIVLLWLISLLNSDPYKHSISIHTASDKIAGHTSHSHHQPHKMRGTRPGFRVPASGREEIVGVD